MLTSTTIQRRQSEIRQTLAELASKDTPSEDETRQMDALDTEYRSNESRYRAALIAEDTERREAGAELESKEDRDFAALIDKFELRQAALFLDEGRQMNGATAEVTQELRNQGGYRGVPVPWQALEVRVGETVAAGTPDPVRTMSTIDRLFPDSVASRMGASMVNIGVGEVEWPVTTGGAVVGWATSETGNVAGPTAYETVDRPLAPDHTLGVQMRVTRKALKQSGAALESAIRRDMNRAMAAEMDRVVFLGAGATGEPLGVIAGAGTYGITSTPVDAAATWGAVRSAIVTFMTDHAAGGPDSVRLLLRPEIWDGMDDLISGISISEWDRLSARVRNIVLTSNALAAPTGSPSESTALLSTSVGGVPPIFVGTWGAVDLIRDIYSDSASGGLRLTALATMDVTISRTEQLQILTGLQ